MSLTVKLCGSFRSFLWDKAILLQLPPTCCTARHGLPYCSFCSNAASLWGHLALLPGASLPCLLGAFCPPGGILPYPGAFCPTRGHFALPGGILPYPGAFCPTRGHFALPGGISPHPRAICPLLVHWAPSLSTSRHHSSKLQRLLSSPLHSSLPISYKCASSATPSRLEEARALTILDVSYCQTLRVIPSLPLVRNLYCYYCPLLSKLLELPMVNKLTCFKCPLLSALPALPMVITLFCSIAPC